jgi:hypothetical protein
VTGFGPSEVLTMSLSSLVTGLAALLAIAGAAALFGGLVFRASDHRRRTLRLAAVGLGAAGLVIMFGAEAGLLGKDMAVWGLMLTVFGSGVSFPGRAADTETSSKRRSR